MPRQRTQLAKLSRPRLHSPVARERLFALLDTERAHPLVWVAGPPGAGKTTLVASYCVARRLTHYVAGRYSDALTCFDRSDAIAADQGLDEWLWISGLWRGLTQRRAGLLNEAEAKDPANVTNLTRLECYGFIDSRADGTFSAEGCCNHWDRDGHLWVGHWWNSSKMQVGRYEVVAGNGKYAGATGGGTASCNFLSPRPDPQVVCEVTGEIELKSRSQAPLVSGAARNGCVSARHVEASRERLEVLEHPRKRNARIRSPRGKRCVPA